MKWLIIGTGTISEKFVDALKSNNESIFAILSRSEESGKRFAEKKNIGKHITQSDKYMNNFDTVYIGTPNSTHYDIAKKYISLGKNVMVEKPMALSFDQTKELYELGKENNVRVMEAYVHITQPIVKTFKGDNIKTNFMQLSSKIKNNTYKTASTFSKALGGGVLRDLGVYPLSFSCMILGEVKDAWISDLEELNEVDVQISLKLTHENGQSEFIISKVQDGDNTVWLDGKNILEHVSFGNLENNMIEELKLFTSKENLNYIKEISLMTIKAIELIRSKI